MAESIKNLMQSAEDELILSEILGKSREFLITHPEMHISVKQKLKFHGMQRKLEKGWPLAYVLGSKWFMNSKFKVNPSVLIPRPETELLVETAVSFAKKNHPKLVVDVGTGSGAIAISIKKALPKMKVVASDVSRKALALAKQNTEIILRSENKSKQKHLKPAIKFVQSNLLAKINLPKANFLITANLPYLSAKELKEKSIRHEPKLALYGGKNPLKKIEMLIKQVAVKNPKCYAIILEINFDQAKKIKALAKKHLPGAKFFVKKDLSGFDRVAVLWNWL